MELPGNFLQGWNYSGIFYRHKILECDDNQGLVSPGRLSPLDQGILVSFIQGFWWQILANPKDSGASLCSCQDVSPHPYKATQLELCLSLSPARGLVSPGVFVSPTWGQSWKEHRDGAGILRKAWKKGCGGGTPVGGTHFWEGPLG